MYRLATMHSIRQTGRQQYDVWCDHTAGNTIC